jgi:AcrR family transcriptional regulator
VAEQTSAQDARSVAGYGFRPGVAKASSWAAGSAPPPTDRRSRRRSRRIYEILETTALVVAERGYHNTSIEEIADRLDLAKPTLYHYFDSKEKLVYETLRVCREFVTTALKEAAAQASSNTERLGALVRRQIELTAVEYPEMSRLFLQPLDWPEPLAESVRAWQQEHADIFRKAINDGVKSGEFTVGNAAITRICLIGAMNVLPPWIERHKGIDVDEAVDTVLRLVLPATAPAHK